MSWTIKWNKKQTIWEWLCLNKFENIVFAIHINGNTEVKQILNGSRSVRPPYEATILSCWRWKFSISKCNWDCYCVHMFFFHSFRTFSVCVCVTKCLRSTCPTSMVSMASYMHVALGFSLFMRLRLSMARDFTMIFLFTLSISLSFTQLNRLVQQFGQMYIA